MMGPDMIFYYSRTRVVDGYTDYHRCHYLSRNELDSDLYWFDRRDAGWFSYAPATEADWIASGGLPLEEPEDFEDPPVEDIDWEAVAREEMTT